MPDWTAISDALGVEIAALEPAGGGCINAAMNLTTPAGGRLFVKANASEKLDMFAAEADALSAIAATGTIRVPRPIAHGVAAGHAYLALEHIEFGPPREGSWAQFGEALAALHGHTATDGKSGWHRDNVIGETHQPNTKEQSWATFFVEHRLRHQFELAADKGYQIVGADELLEKTVGTLGGHEPAPALLHGDLWSGNAGFGMRGEPFVFDPASYYGDPETDLAFTEMFGAFDAAFYAAYHAARPPAAGHEQRKPLYNLYHLLNHANLFGGSYAREVPAAVRRLLR